MKLSAAAFAAVFLALVPATAQGATYKVQLCADPQATGFVAANGNASAFNTVAACPWDVTQRFSGVLVGVKPGTGGMARGSSARWTLTAPSGTTFDEVTVRRRLEKIDRDYEIEVNADGTLVDGCRNGVRCEDEVATRTYEPTAQLAFSVGCAEPSCQNSTGNPRAWLAVQNATATIDDPKPPTLTPVSSTWQRVPDVTVAATDASGIASLTLKTGTTTLGTTNLTCDFRHLQPCPGTGTATFATALPDGIHPLTAQATDAAGQAATAQIGTLQLDRVAPAAPMGLTVRATGTGRYAYIWTNPDQGTDAPIAAAHLSDGTVVKGANIQQLESASPVERIHLEDEAGNADPATAVGTSSGQPLTLKPPILESTSQPRIKLSSAKREGTRLVVKGTVTNGTAAKVTATLKRGSRTARKSANVSRGRFTIRIALSSTMRRKGTVSLTVRHGTAKATKRVRFG